MDGVELNVFQVDKVASPLEKILSAQQNVSDNALNPVLKLFAECKAKIEETFPDNAAKAWKEMGYGELYDRLVRIQVVWIQLPSQLLLSNARRCTVQTMRKFMAS
jgi:hypothetical protein